jgi:hypothetical protein
VIPYDQYLDRSRRPTQDHEIMIRSALNLTRLKEWLANHYKSFPTHNIVPLFLIRLYLTQSISTKVEYFFKLTPYDYGPINDSRAHKQ